MKGIEIQFPGVKALDGVDFTLCRGEVHALLGENGAGKSTLIKCLTGVNKMDAGKIELEGKEIKSITGHTCKRGEAYAQTECTAPRRTLTTTAPVVGGGVVPVKTDATAAIRLLNIMFLSFMFDML